MKTRRGFLAMLSGAVAAACCPVVLPRIRERLPVAPAGTLQPSLAGKAPMVYVHTIADVTNLTFLSDRSPNGEWAIRRHDHSAVTNG